MLARACNRGKTPWLMFSFLLGIFVGSAFGGKTVKVLWDANSEPDLAGYRLYYGKVRGQYDTAIDVGNVTQYQIDNLPGGATYYFVVTAYDTANNESSPSIEVSATLPEDDVTPPALADVKVLAQNSLLVVFTEKVTRESAEDRSNYQIIGGVRVKKAVQNSDGASVNLTTDDHQNGKTYILKVANIQDLAVPPNTLQAGSQWSYTYQSSGFSEAEKDTTPPVVLNVHIPQNNRIEVLFNEKVRKLSAENKANYQITGGISIGQIQLQADERTAVLSTSVHQNATNYILTIRNIADLADPPNIMSRPTQWTYTYHEEDHEPPRLVDVKLNDLTHLLLLFSEKITATSAQEKQNYQISDGIVINAANLQESQKEVILVTTPHQLNHQYTLGVSGIRDQSPFQNQIAANTTFLYFKEGPEPPPDANRNNHNLTVNNISPSDYQVENIEVGQTYYVDQDFRVLRLPDRLQNLVWIKTAYRDRFNTSADFLTFYLNQPAKIYIAYDARATSWPKWLTGNFTRTGLRIEVSDAGKYLAIWQATAQPGRIALGGNMAPEAANASSMYGVIIDTYPFNSQNEAVPEKYVLYQNFPNPFNPRTEISYYLKIPSNVELKIFNMQGQLVKMLDAGQKGSGVHRVTWDGIGENGRSVPSGAYLYVLEIKEQITNRGFTLTTSINRQMKTMTLLK